jgi:hypothetical protein
MPAGEAVVLETADFLTVVRFWCAAGEQQRRKWRALIGKK